MEWWIAEILAHKFFLMLFLFALAQELLWIFLDNKLNDIIEERKKIKKEWKQFKKIKQTMEIIHDK